MILIHSSELEDEFRKLRVDGVLGSLFQKWPPGICIASRQPAKVP